MSDLTKFSEGASILQQVDVSDIFTNLAMGIAEAQQKLDDNSIAQAIKLAETKIDGESLLSLGFAPVFYAFQYADISASINLRMGLKEAMEFGFGIDVQLSNQKGYTTFNRTFLSSKSYSETEEEYKSVRQLNFRAKEKKAIKINNKFVSLSDSFDAKSRVENFKQKIISEAGVHQVYDEVQSRTLSENKSRGVHVWMDGGFLRIDEGLHFNKTGVGLLKIGDIEDEGELDVNGTDVAAGNFTLGGDLVTALTAAKAANTGTSPNLGTVYGLSKFGDLYVYDADASPDPTFVPISSKFYFKFNSDEITYETNLKYDTSESNVTFTLPSGTVTNQNYLEHKLIHKVLRLIRNHDSDASIKITGMTDPKAGDNPKNKSLAKRRAERLRDHIFGTTAPVNVEIGAVTNTEGPSNLSLRHASIELDADYIIFIGGKVKKEATPVKSSTLPNKFVYADDTTGTGGAFTKLDVKYGATKLLATNTSYSTLLNTAKTQLTNHSHEFISTDLYHSLDDEAIVKLHLLTNAAEETTIEENSESDTNGSENQSSYLWAKTQSESAATSESTNNSNQSSSFAFNASVDFRMSKQFEMSMEGNSAMSARLVALPAPDGFRAFLETKYGPGTEG